MAIRGSLFPFSPAMGEGAAEGDNERLTEWWRCCWWVAPAQWNGRECREGRMRFALIPVGHRTDRIGKRLEGPVRPPPKGLDGHT